MPTLKKANPYGCGADDCADCYPYIYRCDCGVDYVEPIPNTGVNRDLLAFRYWECDHAELDDEALVVVDCGASGEHLPHYYSSYFTGEATYCPGRQPVPAGIDLTAYADAPLPH